MSTRRPVRLQLDSDVVEAMKKFSYDGTNVVMSAQLNMNSRKIVGLGSGSADTDAARKDQAGGSGVTLLESVSDWSSQPEGWRNLHGDKDESIDTLTYASGGLTIASMDVNTNATGTKWNPSGVCFHHSSKAFTAVAEFDTFSVGGVDTGDDWWVSIMHSDGLVPHGSTGEIRFYYDKNKSETGATKSWQAYKVYRRGGQNSLTWSPLTDTGYDANITDTTPTSLKLKMQFDDMEGFKVSFYLNGGSEVVIPDANYTHLKADSSVSEISPPGWGPRTFSIVCGTYHDLSSAASVRLVDLEITNAS